MRSRFSILSALAAATIVTNAAGRAVEPLSLEVIFAEEGHARAPSEIAWTEDGKRVSFLWSKTGKRDLWTMDVEADGRNADVGIDREPKVLLRAGEVKDGEREISLKEYAWSPDGKALLLQSSGDLYHYRLADRAPRRLTKEDTKNEDARFSRDSKMVAFVRDADLWTVDVATGEERRLTQDGAEGKILNGKPDWVYWEEIWSRQSIGFWWSPDSKSIAYTRFEEEQVPTYPLMRDQAIDASVERQPYPKPGDRNPKVSVGVLDLAAGKTTWMKIGLAEGDDYAARVRFTPKGDRVAVLKLARDQNQVDLLLCDPATGECETRLTEKLPTWVDIGDDFELLADGRVIWGSDRDGWRRLYLFDAQGGAPRAISPEGVAVAEVDRVVEATGEVFFTGFRTAGLGAKDRQLYRVRLDGFEAEILAPACEGKQQAASAGTGGAAKPCDPTSGSTAAEVAPGGKAWIATHSALDSPPRATLYRGGPSTRVELPFEPARAYDRDALPRFEFLTIPGPGGPDGPGGAALPALVLKPTGFDPKRRYPVVMFHYGGPASQMIEDSSPERHVRHLWHVRMAQKGYVVVTVDNEASAFFGKKGADRVHRRFGPLELEAQLAAVAWLKKQGWVDGERIGLWGWSGGGANTLYSVLESPGTWRAVVAGAPVVDWRLYDSVWTERYLDHPEQNEQGYQDSSAIGKAEKLADALLLVHGTGDDNVHPQNTIMFSRELIKAGKRFEQAIYPDEKHAFTDAANRHFYQRMEDFFDRELGGR